MTYAILNIDSGNFLESYGSETLVWQAAARIHQQEPAATASLAVVTLDDTGEVVEAHRGAEMLQRLDAANEATPA